MNKLLIPKHSRKGKEPRNSISRAPTPWDDLKATYRTASRALSYVKGAASLINAEIKHVDISVAGSSSTTPGLTYISGIAQGDTNLSRDGNSVKLKGGLVKVTLVRHASATFSRVRSLIICDTRNQGVIPSAADVYDSSTTNGLINLDTDPNRYVIISDTMICLDDGHGLTQTREFDITPAIKDMHLVFSGTSALVASAKGPVLYYIQQSNEATNVAFLLIDARLLFVDN